MHKEYDVPGWIEELIVLDFTDIEDALYKDYKKLHGTYFSRDISMTDLATARKLCSQLPTTESEQTLDQIRMAAIEKKRVCAI